MDPRPDCRRSIIEVLRNLSSSDRQLAYELNVPHISVTNELLSMWFDDTYLPDSGEFRRSFSAEELAALAVFDAFFAEHSEALPQPKHGVADWLKDKDWQQIVERASTLLAVLENSQAS